MYLQKILKKMHENQWLICFLHGAKKNHSQAQSVRAEGGFLMLSMVAMILLLGAAYGSFAFTFKKEWNWELNYALGQQFAQVANAAHLYVQSVAYDPDNAAHLQRGEFLTPTYTGNNGITIANLVAAGFLPTSFTLNQRRYQNIGITAYGDRAPRGGAASAAPTAFIVININVDGANNRRRTGADIAAFKAGAASKGLARLGIPVLTTSATTCNTGTSFVRWGDNPNDCLTTADIDNITGTVGFSAAMDQNDVIAPAWEVVNEASDFDAVYRYPQPGRPDAQIINSDIHFDGDDGFTTLHSIRGAGYMDSDVLTVANQMRVNDSGDATNPNTAIGSMTVQGDPLNPATNSTLGSGVTDAVIVSDDVIVDNAQANNGLTIDGDLDIVLGGLNEGAGNNAVLTIDDGVGGGDLGIVTLLQDQGGGLTVNVQGGNDLVVTDRIVQLGGTFGVQASGGNDGDLQAPFAGIDIGPNDINLIGADASSATGEIIVDDIDITNDVQFGSITLSPGSTASIGGEATINADCFGAACPDAIDDAPDDPF